MKNNLHFADIHATVSGNQVTVTSGSTYTTEFMGADFSQIVDDDLLIHRPLNDCVVNLSFRVTDKKAAIDLKPIFLFSFPENTEIKKTESRISFQNLRSGRLSATAYWF